LGRDTYEEPRSAQQPGGLAIWPAERGPQSVGGATTSLIRGPERLRDRSSLVDPVGGLEGAA